MRCVNKKVYAKIWLDANVVDVIEIANLNLKMLVFVSATATKIRFKFN